ncbi:DMT family transporter [Caldimonas brevitalea]|uniref:Multidrug DMT transporter permease n=1 Tax=Caldimonas brevitalea TaxID=413882 RepID=A0A0G3BUM7_9BURK|nr:DMT family transporter [Caldimonas brevitalea]AKJ31723.1 multidrug DMT transporter permease [Caldimonas brevitalea]
MSAATLTTPLEQETRGLWLGLLGVAIFALTLPMTRLATGAAADPQLSPAFVTFGRAALAGLLSIVYLAVVGGPRPQGRQWAALLFTAAGNVLGFPLLLALGLRHVEAVHAAVITGLLPLATAAAAALAFRQRPAAAFWGCAALGSALVVVYALSHSSSSSGGGAGLRAHWADALLVLAVLAASASYVVGARLTPALGAERVICWVLVVSLPLTLPAAGWTWPTQPVRAAAWGGFVYVALFSMWLGFFAWYRALALGGPVRVSQVQLLQPFLSMLFAVPLLGERLDATTLGFGVAVMATVFIGKRLPVQTGKPA